MAPDMRRSMYLRSLHLQNFRSCYNTTVELRPTLTLLVGENNSGKSNVIDSIRLATAPLSGRRTIYFERDDHSHGGEGETVEIGLEYDGLTEIQEAQYIGAVDLQTSRVHYGVRFAPEDVGRRVRPAFFAGKLWTSDPEPEKRDQITHVYLEPLRDVQRILASQEGSRLLRIIEQLTAEEQREDFVSDAARRMEGFSEHKVLTTTATEVQKHLGELTRPVREQRMGVDFVDHSLRHLVRSLRIRMGEEGISLADIAETGLGYANLLFIAMVIIELRNAKDTELTLFLVEEPEAHLHPQLQAVLLDYLKEQAEESGRDDTSGPAGRIQVIATTHSPNLASAIGVEDIVVLRTTHVEDVAADSDGEATVRRSTTAIPIARLGLTDGERRKINQYLDVTRSSLLFARRVLLVEGLAEAVLTPVLARHVVFAGDGQDRHRRRRFHGVTIIAVGSVDFLPYIKLLLTAHDGHSILENLVVITDTDPLLSPLAGEPEKLSRAVNRVAQLRSDAATLGLADRLTIHPAEFTLEADLLAPGGVNVVVLHDAYLKQHPGSEHHWTEIMTAPRPEEALYRKLRSDKNFISKGEFAHDVATAIESIAGFVCPPYLRDAFLAALGMREDARVAD